MIMIIIHKVNACLSNDASLDSARDEATDAMGVLGWTGASTMSGAGMPVCVAEGENGGRCGRRRGPRRGESSGVGVVLSSLGVAAAAHPVDPSHLA